MLTRLLTAAAVLGAALVASAQKTTDYTPIEKTRYILQATGQVPGFRHLADTTGKPATNISTGNTVVVIGQASPRWVVIDYNYLTFYIPQQALGLKGATVLAIDEASKAPLPRATETGLIAYSEVVPVAGASKNELYARGKVWFAKWFTSAQNVIQADDKEAGLLIGKAWSQVYVENMSTMVDTRLWYTVTLNFKDGRYKYEISDFMFQTEPSTTYPDQPKVPAEAAVTTTQKSTTAAKWAQHHRQALIQAALNNTLAMRTGMSTPATGDW